jgi:hypothetical protein
MTTRKQTEAERAKELEKLDLLPAREGQKRADELLRKMLASPPEPHIKAKSKRAKRAK